MTTVTGQKCESMWKVIPTYKTRIHQRPMGYSAFLIFFFFLQFCFKIRFSWEIFQIGKDDGFCWELIMGFDENRQ